MALYDAEIAHLDARLGEQLACMKQRGLYDDTLIIVTADHGEALGEHGESTHGIFLYDSTLRVPLVIVPPGGAPAPRTVRCA